MASRITGGSPPFGTAFRDRGRRRNRGDGAACAHGHQKVPQGHYNVEVMLKAVLKHGGEVGVCSSCMDARGIADPDLAEGARRSSMEQLAAWTREAEKVLVF